MSLVFDPARHRWSGAETAGPAGACDASLGKGVYASVDLATGHLLSIECIARRGREETDALLARLVADAATSDVIRRLAFAQTLASDDPSRLAPWYALDRLRARVELSEIAPELRVGFDDPDLDEVLAGLQARVYVRTNRNGQLLDRAFVALDRLTSRPQLYSAGSDEESDVFRPRLPSVGLPAAELPELVVLSHGADLAMAIGRSPGLVGVHADGVLELALAVPDAEEWAQHIVGYLLEPDRDDPVSAIGKFTATDPGTVKVALPVREHRSWAGAELVLLPSHTELPPARLRQVLRAEVALRTAVRLAHKGYGARSAERFEAAIDILVRAREVERAEQARALLDSTRRDGGPSGLLADV